MLLVIATGAAVYLVLALGCAIVYTRCTIVYTDTLTLWRGIENTYGDGIVDIGKYLLRPPDVLTAFESLLGRHPP